jgi:hypothetical protein
VQNEKCLTVSAADQQGNEKVAIQLQDATDKASNVGEARQRSTEF